MFEKCGGSWRPILLIWPGLRSIIDLSPTELQRARIRPLQGETLCAGSRLYAAQGGRALRDRLAGRAFCALLRAPVSCASPAESHQWQLLSAVQQLQVQYSSPVFLHHLCRVPSHLQQLAASKTRRLFSSRPETIAATTRHCLARAAEEITHVQIDR